MGLKKEEAIKRVERYLRRSDSHPRFVNVNNSEDMNALRQHFAVGENVFKSVADFSGEDENLLEDALYHAIAESSGAVFLIGITSYYRLLGEQRLEEVLERFAGMSLLGMHLVVVCYQCEKYLSKVEQRYSQFIYLIDGPKQSLPQLIFAEPEMPATSGETVIEGVQNIAAAVEGDTAKKLLIHTKKQKSAYPHSVYQIKELRDAYDALCSVDVSTEQLKEEYGTEQDWSLTLTRLSEYGSWIKYIQDIFGTTTNLELVSANWKAFDTRRKWLYFIGLKLYGAKHSWCLNEAINAANSSSMFIREVFRSLLTVPHDDPNFWNRYDERKNLIQSLGNPDEEVMDYCSMVKSQGENALYYLTDTSKAEQNLIFENLARYSDRIGHSKVMEILGHVYPALYAYLQPYHYKMPLLDTYFQEYKYQKVVNKVFPDFLQLVDEQAEKREFNLFLPARSEKVDAIEKKGTIVYFMDAMGAEYLSFIMDQCRRRKLMAYTTLCHCDLPSITSCNKEFVDTFLEGGADFVPDKNGIKSLDDLKHHGKEEFDFTNNELPTYISSELDIIGATIEKIATKLMNGDYKRAVMISDHGASRLCVLSRKEIQWGSVSNAEHSGRCCPVSEIDEKPSCAIEENGYWVLANYDRFKGGRKANIEVHGGATLEEVVVPIIEIVYSPEEIELELPQNITFSRHKKNARISIFSKTKLDSLSVRISGLDGEYDGETSDGHTFTFALPELRKAGDYFVDVYYNNNLLKSGLKFTAKNTDFSQRKLI